MGNSFWGTGPGLDAFVNYFGVLAGVGSAILGLALVTFTLQVAVWRTNPLRQAVAITTLAELSTPVFYGLLFLTPRHPWHVAGYIVGALGYAVMAFHVIQFMRYKATATSFDKKQMWGILVTVISFSIMALHTCGGSGMLILSSPPPISSIRSR